MQRPTFSRLRLAIALAALCTIWLQPLDPPHALAAGLNVAPASIDVTLPLGDSAATTIQLASDGPALTALLYEALPPAQTAANPNTLAAPARAPLPAQPSKLDPEIASRVSAADQRADVIIYLADQADLSGAYRIADWDARGQYVYDTLTAHANRTQQSLRARLAKQGIASTPYWIVNAIGVQSTLADAAAIAARSDVAAVRAVRTATLPPDASAADAAPAAGNQPCSPDDLANPVCWNVRHTGASRVWRDFGVDGAGVVVAGIDTGVGYTHPALVGSYRGARQGGTFDHNYSWFDPQRILAAPTDNNGHGTHTMGTMVARGAGDTIQPAVGVAPGARWIAAQGCDGASCSDSDLIASAQWVLAPTNLAGNSPRPDLRPMIVNNSWAGGSGGDSFYAGYTAAWRAAGIFPVFAAGNASSRVVQACGSILSPADYSDVVAVGATDKSDAATSFTLFGPASGGRLKPDFTAPGTYGIADGTGVGIYSTRPPTSQSAAPYGMLQGTSMATPLVSGIVALLWSANPALIGNYDATYAILRQTAKVRSETRCGDAAGGANNVYGNGVVDAYAAVAAARVDLPWLDLGRASVDIVAGGTAAISVTLSAAKVPGPGVYRGRVQVYQDTLGGAPISVPVTLTVTPVAGQVIVSGRVMAARGGQPLSASVGVLGGVSVRTSSTGTYSLTLAPGSYTIEAGALSYTSRRVPLVVAAGGPIALDIALEQNQATIAVANGDQSATLGIGQTASFSIPISNTGSLVLNYTASVLPSRYAAVSSQSGLPDAPVYRWVDLPSGAARLASGDDLTLPIALGFSFPIYGRGVTSALVGSGGQLTFGPALLGGISPACVPDLRLPIDTVAPLHAPFALADGGAVRYGLSADGAAFVVSYEGMRLPGEARPYSFQALLYRDGRIVYQYRDIPAVAESMSAGVWHVSDEATTLGCGQTLPIASGMAFELRPQPDATDWLTIGDADGAVVSGRSASLTVIGGWALPPERRTLRGTVRISSNDPQQPAVDVPISITSIPAPQNLFFPGVGS